MDDKSVASEILQNKSPVRSLSLLGDMQLASGSEDGTIHIWDLKEKGDSRHLNTLTGHKSDVWSLDTMVDPTNNEYKIIISASPEKTVRVWKEKDNGEIVSDTLTGHTSAVYSVCALGDGRLASGSFDETIRIWDLKKGGEHVQTLTGHTGSVLSVCALGDGRLASCFGDRTIRIWDLNKEKEKYEHVQTLTGHTDYVHSVCALGDGRLASGSDDKAIRIFH